ncbi:MAG: ArsI/CadI family heavy metal resistance metalloenzyme [Blastocatellia bacterium]
MATENTQIQTLKAHLAINVRDTETSISFYKKMFGIEPSKVRTGYAKFDVHNPPLNFTLNQVPFGERGALSHLGIQVASTEDVLTMKQRWVDAGLSTFDEMDTACCYAVQDKSWVSDPDGNEWEVFVVKEDNLPEGQGKAGDSVCCATAPVGISKDAAQPAIGCC